MNRGLKLILFGLLIAVIFPGVALATIFGWHDRVRPPVSLREAIDIAEGLLGDDKSNRYCVSVSLHGNPVGEPKPGAWNLFFAAKDGSKKYVHIDMDRNAKLSTWNEAINWAENAGRRRDLDDVVERLHKTFEKEHLKVTISKMDNFLTASYKPRKYLVHRANADGSFAENATEVEGPQHDGFCLEAKIVNEVVREAAFKREVGPYWTTYTSYYPLTQPGKFLSVKMKTGEHANGALQRQMYQAFGIDYPNP